MLKVRQLLLIYIKLGKFKKRICKSWSLPFSVSISPLDNFRISISYYKNLEISLGKINIIICKLED